MVEQENQLITPKEQNGYAEEIIIPDGTEHILRYSLSNSLDDIKIAVFSQTGLNIDLDKAYWKINPGLSISVKHLMNKHRVIYSMTTWHEGRNRHIIVNMRVNDTWFITGFDEF
jgi:hypothetical protein